MTRRYSDSTANTAISSVDRELGKMKKRAEQIKVLRQKGLFSAEDEAKARRQFIGIYKRFLLEALDT